MLHLKEVSESYELTEAKVQEQGKTEINKFYFFAYVAIVIISIGFIFVCDQSVSGWLFAIFFATNVVILSIAFMMFRIALECIRHRNEEAKTIAASNRKLHESIINYEINLAVDTIKEARKDSQVNNAPTSSQKE